MSMESGITKSERAELVSLVRARSRVAKAGVDQRKAELLADLEQELASIYHIGDQEIWAAAFEAANKAAQDADAQVAQVCEELGIREEFRPRISGVAWYGRGENAANERRVELRRVAGTRLDAEAKKAKLAIESASVEMQTALAAGAFQSAEAKAFLETMPTPESLLTPLVLPELEAAVPKDRFARWA